MGIFDIFRRKPRQPATAQSVVPVEALESAYEAKLTDHEKRELTVRRVTLPDMEQFAALPFMWNREIKKVIGPSMQPYAYMDIVGANVNAARLELEKMNKLLFQAHRCTPSINKNAYIPVDDITFTPRTNVSYSKIICNPYTFSGRISKYPVSLLFMTKHVIDADSTHGQLFYGQNGAIQKAEIFCWRKKKGFFFYFETVDGTLTLSRVELSNVASGTYAPPAIIYKGPHILAAEALRAQDETDYQWLQINIADACPKSLSGYRRMKMQGSKNYQNLKARAAELGRNI